MKTLYIAGLDSKPNPVKMKILEQYGFETTELVPDYRKLGEKTLELVINTAIDSKAEAVMGSSMGGFFGFWIAEKLGLPCLLFNPAMQLKSIPIELPVIENKKCPKRFVILGDQDDVVNPIQNSQFFQSIERTTCNQRVIRCSWLTHQIDLETFRDSISWAATSFMPPSLD